MVELSKYPNARSSLKISDFRDMESLEYSIFSLSNNSLVFWMLFS